MEHLLRNVGRPIDPRRAAQRRLGYDYYGTTRTVDVHVRRLKQKLPILDDAIVSIKSLGYKLREADQPGMNLGIRWKVALGTLAAVLIGLVVAGWLVIRLRRTDRTRAHGRDAGDAKRLAAMTLRPLLISPAQPCRPLSSMPPSVN